MLTVLSRNAILQDILRMGVAALYSMDVTFVNVVSMMALLKLLSLNWCLEVQSLATSKFGLDVMQE